ncbi:MAG: SDR family oxidoreductase [Thermoproteota archaeon]|nr:SDR family oxidoreductase [Thermoproteota archaeon]
MDSNQKVAVVTGSSSGIGLETAFALAKKGYITYATMRDLQKSKVIEKFLDRENVLLKIVEMNVNDDYSVKNAVDKIMDEHGRIDVMVNNAGYGLFGALEDLEMEEIKKQFETNVFGIIRVTKNILPIMRRQRSGIIVNISSLSGLVGIPSQSIYSGTKFAVEGISESLSYEVEPHGIKILLVEPGVINTDFVHDLIVPANQYGVNKNGEKRNNQLGGEDSNFSSSCYKDTIGKFLSSYYDAMRKAPSPDTVANEIIQSIEKAFGEYNPVSIMRIQVGNDSKKYSKLKKDLSDIEFHKMLRKNLLK